MIPGHWQRGGPIICLNSYKHLNTTSLVKTIKTLEASYLWSPGYLSTNSVVIFPHYSNRDHNFNFVLINICHLLSSPMPRLVCYRNSLHVIKRHL